jgi:hypothetical protein
MWLTIHVLTITLSYAAFFLAMAIAHVCLGLYFFSPGRRELLSKMSLFLYRCLQVGVLLGAAGTLLGGWWASYSWGRFWGWDAKETSIFVALMFYLAILHGRMVGLLRDFGTAVAGVLGFLGVLWAWYGVNFVLGVGLHSYGFGSGGYVYVGGFVAFEVAVVARARCAIARCKEGAGRSPAPTTADRALAARYDRSHGRSSNETHRPIVVAAALSAAFAASRGGGQNVTFKAGWGSLRLLVTPEERPFPAVIIIRNGGPRRQVRTRRAPGKEGYVARRRPCHGKVADKEEDASAHERAQLRRRPARSQGADAYLQSHADVKKGHGGAIGWCMGGMCARLATEEAGLKAVVASALPRTGRPRAIGAR